MAGNDAKVRAPYLGNSTTAKTMVLPFVAISHAYAVFPQTCQIGHLTVEKIWMKAGAMTIYILR